MKGQGLVLEAFELITYSIDCTNCINDFMNSPFTAIFNCPKFKKNEKNIEIFYSACLLNVLWLK